MEIDQVQLGFTFAKELATQLITLSTGLLALSVAFTKDILKSIPKGREQLLKSAWGVHLASICCGVWTLMALTGTLMPLHADPAGSPLAFAGNVRIPAIGQVSLFVLGTLFLVLVYGTSSLKHDEEEFRVAVLAPAALTTELNALKADNWEFVAFSAQGGANITVLLKRSKPPMPTVKPG
jgi:hypothetical protein